MHLFSIIIPVYNTSEFRFRRCIHSILSQTYDYFEVIVVDDGSEQECYTEICKICDLDDRIRLLKQSNKGAGAARNYGIKEAKGDYIIFVDSDDVVMDYMLEEVANCLDRYNADIVGGEVVRFSEDKWDPQLYEKKPESWIVLDNEEKRTGYINNFLGYSKEEYGRLSDGPVSKACRSSLIKKVLFPEDNIWDEDTIWNIEISAMCKTICVSNNMWYVYFMNESSQTHTFRKNCPYEFETRIEQEISLAKRICPDCLKGIYSKIWTSTYVLFDTYINHKENTKSKTEKYKTFKRIIHLPGYIEMLRNIEFINEKNRFSHILKLFIKNVCLYCSPAAFVGWKCLLLFRKGIH